jgi:hypothetical protein
VTARCGHFNCDVNAECRTNEEGESVCACRSGYHGNGISCTQIYQLENDDRPRLLSGKTFEFIKDFKIQLKLVNVDWAAVNLRSALRQDPTILQLFVNVDKTMKETAPTVYTRMKSRFDCLPITKSVLIKQVSSKNNS